MDPFLKSNVNHPSKGNSFVMRHHSPLAMPVVAKLLAASVHELLPVDSLLQHKPLVEWWGLVMCLAQQGGAENLFWPMMEYYLQRLMTVL